MSHDLIDTTEMYLRTIFELQEEGIAAKRARIVERLSQSGPTVSQTVARMQRDGLLTLDDENIIVLTEAGADYAAVVMRRHRLAEVMLVQVLGVDVAEVHREACRWEHVLTETVERRILALCNHPTHSPFGNPIPALDQLGEGPSAGAAGTDLATYRARLGDTATAHVLVTRIGETLQADDSLLTALLRAGVSAGAQVKVTSGADGGLLIGSGGEYLELTPQQAAQVFVQAPAR